MYIWNFWNEKIILKLNRDRKFDILQMNIYAFLRTWIEWIWLVIYELRNETAMHFYFSVGRHIWHTTCKFEIHFQNHIISRQQN